MDEIDVEKIINYVQDDSLFPNINEVVFNKSQAREMIEMGAVQFGYKLWMYLPVNNHKFQNPVSGKVFSIEQIYNGEDDD